MPFLVAELSIWLIAAAAAGLIVGLTLGRTRRRTTRTQNSEITSLRSTLHDIDGQLATQRKRVEHLTGELEQTTTNANRVTALEAQLRTLRSQAPAAPLAVPALAGALPGPVMSSAPLPPPPPAVGYH